MTFKCEACGHQQAWRTVGAEGCERCDAGELAPAAAPPASR